MVKILLWHFCFTECTVLGYSSKWYFLQQVSNKLHISHVDCLLEIDQEEYVCSMI
jgi:hypothetical protein